MATCESKPLYGLAAKSSSGSDATMMSMSGAKRSALRNYALCTAAHPSQRARRMVHPQFRWGRKVKNEKAGHAPLRGAAWAAMESTENRVSGSFNLQSGSVTRRL